MITLSKLLQKRSDKVSGSTKSFDLKFSQDKTYDLDVISKTKNRAATGTELLLGIKYDKDIAPIVWQKLNDDITNSLKSTFRGEDVRNAVVSTIHDYFSSHGDTYADISDYSELNRLVDKTIQDFVTEPGLKFSIYFDDDHTAEVKWDYRSDDYFSEKFNDYYKRYANLYQNELENVDEGALSLSDVRQKIPTSSLDYKRYLLNHGTSQYGNVIKQPQITGRRPVIIVHEGSDDKNNTNDNQETIYDTINQLSQTISDYEELIRQYENKLKDYNAPKIVTTDVIDDNTPDTAVPTVKAVKDYLDSKIQNYNPETPISYDTTSQAISGDITVQNIGGNDYIVENDQLYAIE